jgi:predicted ATP-dependent protease
MKRNVPPLPAEALRWRCDPAQLGFETTDDVPPIDGMVGQARGVGAIAFGLGMACPGYNVYVAGPAGSGRTTTVRRQVEQAAAQRPAPPDWCYLHNFLDPYQPVALQLPPGRGPELARDVDELIAGCHREIPRVLESDQYQQKRAALLQSLDSQRQAYFQELRALAEQLGFSLEFTPSGIVSTPLLAPGRPVSPEAFELLPPEKQAELRAKSQQLERKVSEVMLGVHHLEREAHEQFYRLEREAVGFAVGHWFDGLRTKYVDQPRVVDHLNRVQADLLDHLAEFRGTAPPSESSTLLPRISADDQYRVNVLVTRTPEGHAPVVFEPNPTYYNLVGRIDYRAGLAAMHTDFSLIKPGALHQANGGFLVLRARDLLGSPFAWDALKRALRHGEIRLENLGEQFSAFPTATLKPEPIPLQVKVVLVGDLTTFLLLYRLDEDFPELFKVKAQFGPAMDRSAESIRAYAAFVSQQVHAHGLLPFDQTAVARVIEHAARLVEHQARLATHFSAVADLVVEADHWARADGADRVEAAHVDRALAEQDQRSNLLEEEVQRLIDEGTIAIDTHAQVVGQVNGLAMADLGDYAFARPTRITARAGMGADGVVNIEREVELSGRTHSKGVLILSGYLLGQYAQTGPLALSARLAFEQTYDEVDGDSASSAELYALLSSLAGLPIRQGIAVTGSVNQRGEIQAVGGVTRKIEGYYAVCKAQGLDGRQGVLVPTTNARHLMLRQEVVDAVARGQFHVWAIRTVDEGIALLTGQPAGECRQDGAFPLGTVHDRVQQRLRSFATRLAAYGGRRPLAPSLGADKIDGPARRDERHRRVPASH